ncbi:MAG: DNA gyrase subunit B [Helicobacter sp.]|nr:DNA gyrase subunit B [Helicobacter sp.]
MLRIIFNIVIALISISYPIVLFFIPLEKLGFSFFVFALVWVIYFFYSKDIKYLFISSIIWFLLIVHIIFELEIFIYLYPVLINLSLLGYFALSLKGEAIITKFAKRQHKILEDFVVEYTRKLTYIWCVFFTFNALISFILALLEDKIYWSFYCGFVSYGLIGVLIISELIYRKSILKPKKEYCG